MPCESRWYPLIVQREFLSLDYHVAKIYNCQQVILVYVLVPNETDALYETKDADK
jgi:hypothetical protein